LHRDSAPRVSQLRHYQLELISVDGLIILTVFDVNFRGCRIDRHAARVWVEKEEQK
jgi:hypothetical protein